MAAKTLTARVSVRVTAKNETDTSEQKKRDGGNVAKALGGTDLTDSEKEAIGEALGETVTGEDGRTYARSDKVAGALKNLKASGKLQEGVNKYKYGNVAAIDIAGLPDHYRADGGWNSSMDEFGPINPSGATTIAPNQKNANGATSPGPNWGQNGAFYYQGGITIGIIHNINTGNYNVLSNNGRTFYTQGEHSGAKTYDSWESYSAATGVPITDVGESLLSLTAYGDEHEDGRIGGAKIDPTGKTDDQIKNEIEEAAAANNAVTHFSMNPTDTYVAVTDEHGNVMYFLGT